MTLLTEVGRREEREAASRSCPIAWRTRPFCRRWVTARLGFCKSQSSGCVLVAVDGSSTSRVVLLEVQSGMPEGYSVARVTTMRQLETFCPCVISTGLGAAIGGCGMQPRRVPRKLGGRRIRCGG